MWNYVNFTENNLNTSIASEIQHNKIIEMHKKLAEKLCPLNILFSTQLNTGNMCIEYRAYISTNIPCSQANTIATPGGKSTLTTTVLYHSLTIYLLIFFCLLFYYRSGSSWLALTVYSSSANVYTTIIHLNIDDCFVICIDFCNTYCI